MAPPAGAECSEHPEGGHAHLQRRWTVRSQTGAPPPLRSAGGFSVLHFPLCCVAFRSLALTPQKGEVLQEERSAGG